MERHRRHGVVGQRPGIPEHHQFLARQVAEAARGRAPEPRHADAAQETPNERPVGLRRVLDEQVPDGKVGHEDTRPAEGEARPHLGIACPFLENGVHHVGGAHPPERAHAPAPVHVGKDVPADEPHDRERPVGLPLPDLVDKQRERPGAAGADDLHGQRQALERGPGHAGLRRDAVHARDDPFADTFADQGAMGQQHGGQGRAEVRRPLKAQASGGRRQKLVLEQARQVAEARADVALGRREQAAGIECAQVHARDSADDAAAFATPSARTGPRPRNGANRSDGFKWNSRAKTCRRELPSNAGWPGQKKGRRMNAPRRPESPRATASTAKTGGGE